MLELSNAEVAIRVLAAAAAGAIIGFERELSNQTAGLRTHILVSLGSCLFTMTGAFAFGSAVDGDPTRVAAQVVTGIGFLGAGAILRQGVNVKGLTTSAGLWVTAALGMAIAFGFWVAALVTTLVAALALLVLKQLERRLLRRLQPGRFEFVITARDTVSLGDLTKAIEGAGCTIESVIDEVGEDQRRLSMTLRHPPRQQPQVTADLIREVEGVTSVEWTR